MAYLNRATLIGNIGKDPEIKTLQNGRKFVSFSLATSKRYRDNNGEQKEETQWLCRKCGHVEISSKAPYVCPVCNHPQGYFEIFCGKL